VALDPVTFAVLLVAVPCVVTSFFAWSTSAWRRGRRWAWWVWAVVSGLDVLTGLVRLGVGGSSWSAWYALAVGGGTLILLNHPANRDRRKGPVQAFRVNAHPADASYYS
jgi:hypothetical protein